MSFQFKPAVRENVHTIIGLAGASGSGKTYSAMRLASGMANGKRFAVIDTEAGRARHYADYFDFDHCDLEPPFRPATYLSAIKAAESAGYSVIVVDSMSHEYSGDGGILDWHDEELERMAGSDWKKRERVKMAAWIKPKMEHKKMVSGLLQIRAHLILCFRAEEKVEMTRDDSGKMNIQKVKTLTGLDGWCPITEKNLPFELTASLLLLPSDPGKPLPIKLQEQHRSAFADGTVTEDSGAKIIEWANGGKGEPKKDNAEALKRLKDHLTALYGSSKAQKSEWCSLWLGVSSWNDVSKLDTDVIEYAIEKSTTPSVPSDGQQFDENDIP